MEYPKMLYRPGANPDHHHWGEPLPMVNGEFETLIVEDEDGELKALEEGWTVKPEVAEKKGPGRPKNEVLQSA